jgi:hypothetical protein
MDPLVEDLFEQLLDGLGLAHQVPGRSGLHPRHELGECVRHRRDGIRLAGTNVASRPAETDWCPGYGSRVSRPIVSQLWIAAAERALDAELVDLPLERKVEVRSQLRVAAMTAEELINLVAGPRGAARSSTIAAFVERFGDRALDIDYMGAAFIEEAVASALLEIGIDPGEGDRVAARCRGAVREAGAAIDTLNALTTG